MSERGNNNDRNVKAYPPNARVLIRSSPTNFSDELAVSLSSIFVVGSVIWGPFLTYSIVKKIWKKYGIDEKHRKKLIFIGTAIAMLIIAGPYRNRRFGKLLNVRSWSLWKRWLRFIAFEVVQDLGDSHTKKNDDDGSSLDLLNDQAIISVIPHGIFPFGLAFAALPEDAVRAFGVFRPVVASATKFFPFVRTLISWMGGVDASRSAVNAALKDGHSIGLSPGGIAEMFEGYPKKGRFPNDEVVLLANRKGFIKMALRHGLPVVPVYTFGATKMLRRLELPFLEKLSNFLRISICIFYGKMGLPMPFKQKLLYVIGRPIRPPIASDNFASLCEKEQNDIVSKMHQQFCSELVRVFEKYKSVFDWSHKDIVIC